MVEIAYYNRTCKRHSNGQKNRMARGGFNQFNTYATYKNMQM